MRVKFTNPLVYRLGFNGEVIVNNFFKGDKILFGQVKQVVDEYFLEVECVNETGKLVKYIVNPNSDYNFGFIWNEEAEKKFEDKVNTVAEKIEKLDKIITE